MKQGLVAGAWLLLACAGARAEDGPYVSPTMERLRLTFGVMDIRTDTTLRLDGSSVGTGTQFSAESDFGEQKNKLGPKFQAVVRFEERNRLRFDYFILDRSSTTTLARPIKFVDSTLLQGEVASSEFDLQIASITYGYSFLHNPSYELAGTAGVNIIDFSAQVRVQDPTHFVNSREDQAGMFPTAGLDGTWALSKRFYLDGRFQYLRVKVGRFDGSLSMLEFAAIYRWRANLSAGLGYHRIRANLTSTDSSSAGYFDFNTQGPEAFVRIAF